MEFILPYPSFLKLLSDLEKKPYLYPYQTKHKVFRILIIDDEQAIRSVIKDICNQFIPMAEIIGEADSVASGLEAIRQINPDIVLLDIRLGDGTGFDILNRAENIAFKVIFVTAYENFAIRAFKYSAVDYILKPIDPEELAHAIHKAGNLLQQEMQQRLNALKENLDPENSVKKILIKTATDIFLVKTNEIICCESDQSYSRLYLTNEKVILVSRPLREFDDMLQPAGFFRIHKSFLINLLHFDHYDRTEGGYVMLRNGLRIPVASRKRDQFLQLIENMI